MSMIFDRLKALTKACVPRILELNWANFGNYAPYGETGDIPKNTGVLLHFTAKPIVGANTQMFGFLPKPEGSAKVVVSKVRLLQENASAMASIELRSPPEKWGGAIRSSYGADSICAITGLPEIGDHLLMAQLMRECSLLKKEHWRALTDPNTACIQAAMAYAELTPPEFEILGHRIFEIVQDGLTTLKAMGLGVSTTS